MRVAVKAETDIRQQEDAPDCSRLKSKGFSNLNTFLFIRIQTEKNIADPKY